VSREKLATMAQFRYLGRLYAMDLQKVKVLVWGTMAATLLSLGAHAQFHNKTQTGATTVNPQAIQHAQQQAAQMSGHPSGMGMGMGENSSMFMSDAQREIFMRNNPGLKLPQLGKMNERYAEIWGRAIHHPDGTHTESKQDNETRTLTQETKKGDTVLQRRMILLDEAGRPTEAMIYDGRGQFRYRGTQIYDRMGRFAEEQIYDPDEKLIRRRIQEYAPNGEKLPLRSVDYVENVPEDLKLVITRESESELTAQATQVPEPAPQKRGFFGKQNREAATPVQATAPAPAMTQAQPVAAQPEKRKGMNLGRFFSGKRDK